jgi:NitT/TauT family transport system ATP-binding protein
MLLDEPFRGLDAMTRELLQEYFLNVFEENPITTVFVTTEIEEAIFLSDVIVMLSNPPTSVKNVIEVDLPRPRKLSMLSSPRFAELQTAALDGLLEEARKAFAEGMDEAAELMEAFGQAMRGRMEH